MGEPFRPAPPEIRAAVARLMRETDTSTRAIALTTGLSSSTIRDWNRKEGWRPLRIRRRCWEAALPRLAALERLARAPRKHPPARPEGGPAPQAPARSDPARDPAREADRRDAEPAADLPALRRQLRAHVGRQIAAFDAALRGEGAAVIDSARVLRDLGGLKRLLDDLNAETGGGDDASGALLPLDLPALRADIARRFACLSDDEDKAEADAEAPGEPAGAAPADALP